MFHSRLSHPLFIVLLIAQLPAFAFQIEQVAEFQVSPSNVNLFATALAYRDGDIYTVNVEPAGRPANGINLRTVVRKGTPRAGGNWHWQTHVLENDTLDDPYHTQASIGVDKLGYIHVVYNMHNMPWQYAVSTRPGDISRFEFRGDRISTAEKVIVKRLNKTPFPSLGTAAIPGNQITYPAFFYDRNRDLYITYRFATRPKRSFKDRGFAGGLARYDTKTARWIPLGGVLRVTTRDADLPAGQSTAQIRAFAFTDHWSVYLMRLAFDGENGMHVSWLWREGGAGRDTSHPSYAYSPDGGTRFYNSLHEAYDLPIAVEKADMVMPGWEEAKFNARSTIQADASALPYIVVHPRGYSRALVHFDKTERSWSAPETMPYGAPELFIDKDGAHWAVATGPVIFQRSGGDARWHIRYKNRDGMLYGYPQILEIPGERKFLLYTQSVKKDSVKIFMVEY